MLPLHQPCGEAIQARSYICAATNSQLTRFKEIGQIVRALVSEINIVGMFPHIASEQCRLSKTKWIHTVFSFGDLESTIGILHQPAPSRPKLASTGSLELILERIN